MRARLKDSVCFLIAIAPALASTAAQAGELLVMPYRCSAMGGEVVLQRSPDEGHRILSRREDRDFTACSPVDPAMCRKWTVHRFDVDCGGARVPWTAIVAAADRDRSAWVENGRLQIRMPSWWTAGGGARPGDEIVRMPPGFAPKFGIDAIFVADDGRNVAASGDGAVPRVGGYSSGRANRLSAHNTSNLGNAPPDAEYEVQPGSALPPIGAAQPGAGAPSRPVRPGNLPFEVKPPEDGLTVDDVSEPNSSAQRAVEPEFAGPDTDEPPLAETRPVEPRSVESRSLGHRPEHTFASAEPAPAPEMTWSEPPPLPERLDPSVRRELAQSSQTGNREQAQLAEAPVTPSPPMTTSNDLGTAPAPAIINNSPASAGETGARPEAAPPDSTEAASYGPPASEEQAGSGAGEAASDAAAVSDAVDAAGGDPVGTATTPITSAASGEFPASPNEADVHGPAQQGLIARVLSGEPAAVSVAVIAIGLLALLGLGLSLRRRRQDNLPEFADRDISSVSFDDGSSRAQRAPDAMVHGMGGAMLDFPSASVPPMREPTLDTAVKRGTAAPSLTPAHARRNRADEWGDAIPKTHAEALRVLGMGVSREASPASIKKVVDGLRMSWHPDYAEDDADRRLRELRLKQINAAWEIISGARSEQPEPQLALRPEKLHQL